MKTYCIHMYSVNVVKQEYCHLTVKHRNNTIQGRTKWSLKGKGLQIDWIYIEHRMHTLLPIASYFTVRKHIFPETLYIQCKNKNVSNNKETTFSITFTSW